MVGCETAEYLAEQGCQVSVVEMSEKIASEVGMTVLPTMLEFFKEHAIAQFTGHKVINIRANEVICENQDGQTVKIPCDYVVMASGARSVKFDTAPLTDKGISVVEIGDCRQVANISQAIKTGYEAANAL